MHVPVSGSLVLVSFCIIELGELVNGLCVCVFLALLPGPRARFHFCAAVGLVHFLMCVIRRVEV